MTTLVPVVAAALLTVPCLCAQSQLPTSISFEVASIRLHKGDVLLVGGSYSGSRLKLVALSLTNLIADAYHRERYQISGAQAWMDSERYDILANAPGEVAPSPENGRLMLQALLADRFHLQIHMETKESPIYGLVIGKNGPKLKESTADEYSQTASGVRTAMMTFSKATMEQLASNLSHSVGRPVFDKTGLRRFYDFKLNWTPDYSGPPAPDSNGVDIFTALQEQLGLKLEPQRAPIEFIVIDHAEKPSEN